MAPELKCKQILNLRTRHQLEHRIAQSRKFIFFLFHEDFVYIINKNFANFTQNYFLKTSGNFAKGFLKLKFNLYDQ